MQGETGGGDEPAVGQIKIPLNVYNMGIIYTFLCPAVMNYGIDS